MKIKLSQWHSGKTKPVREGIYERLHGRAEVFYYWNGGFWEFGGVAFIEDVERTNRKSPDQNLWWRGVVK